MRTAKKERLRVSPESGLIFRWVPGNNFPSSNLWEKYNSESKEVRVGESLFADDTTGAGKKAELENGIDIIKEEMAKLEERNNDDKEEELIFGTEDGEKIRMLGSYIGQREDIKQRKKRAGLSWFKLKKQLKNSRLSKRMQARIVEAVVESTILFDCQVRVWYKGEIKELQSVVDKMYRYIWSKKNGPPLIQMQAEHKNMQDVRNELKIKSLRSKIEKRVLQRIGHVFRMEDTRITKAVTLGWLKDLEALPKVGGKKRKTLLYWKRLIKEAGLDYTKIGDLTKDRKEWRILVRKRARKIEEWEKKAGHGEEGGDRGERNTPPPALSIFECHHCHKICRSKAGLTTHIRRMHERSALKVTFPCDKCDRIFKQEGNLRNHEKICTGERASSNDVKKCNKCKKEITNANFRRHVNKCNRDLPDILNLQQARVHKPARGRCDQCGRTLEKKNIARHKKSGCPGRRALH